MQDRREEGSMRRLSNPRSLVLVLVVAVLVLGAQGCARHAQEVWLVMPEEAAMAPPGAASGPRSRGPRSETGPIIEVLRPVIEGPTSVPIEIEVQFIPRQAPVDVGSLKVILLKLINLDITDRVKPYTSSTGIHIPNAKLPSGHHDLRITLADVDGNMSNKQVSLTIP
jgi:hypothetical protein